jgi:predicted transcriptional regulator
MKVLLSVKPEFALKIFDGTKKYEYRRVIFKKQIDTILVYASDPLKSVIGEFNVGEILHKTPEQLWIDTGIFAGVTKEYFGGYFKNQKMGYAIEIRETRKYQKALSLGDLSLTFPPQSFVYLDGDMIYNTYEPSQNPQVDFVPLQAFASG